MVQGRRAKIAGIVCMDLSMADVSEIHDVQAGDEVVLLGKQGSEEISAAEMASPRNACARKVNRLVKEYRNTIPSARGER